MMTSMQSMCEKKHPFQQQFQHSPFVPSLGGRLVDTPRFMTEVGRGSQPGEGRAACGPVLVDVLIVFVVDALDSGCGFHPLGTAKELTPLSQWRPKNSTPWFQWWFMSVRSFP